MNDLLHFVNHLVGLWGETSHPSLLKTGWVFLTTMGLYWKKLIDYMKDLF